MLTNVKKMLAGTEREAGFTLIEMLIVILIVGILSAVALPLYLGYTKDARLAEGKAIGGSALTALSGCVQAKGSGNTCGVADILTRVGLDSSGSTYDKRWVVSAATLSVDSGTPPALTGTINVKGVGSNNSNMALSIFVETTGVTMRCDTSSDTPPTATDKGEPC